MFNYMKIKILLKHSKHEKLFFSSIIKFGNLLSQFSVYFSTKLYHIFFMLCSWFPILGPEYQHISKQLA